MKIGIDARLYAQTGVGRYVENLIRELEGIDTENDYVIFVTKKGSEAYRPSNPRFKKWILDIQEYSVSEQTTMVAELMKAHLDLLHVPHFNVPLLYPRKFVVTVHDFTMHGHTSEASTKSASVSKIKELAYRLTIQSAAKRSRAILVPSNTIKTEVLERMKGISAEKVTVTYEGVDPQLLAQTVKDLRILQTRLEEMRIRKKYLLYVGSAYPHKNLETLIISVKNALDENKLDAQLVIAGKVDFFSQKTAGFAHALQLDNDIVFAAKYTEKNKITDQHLAYLYHGATAYISVSKQEGFSVPPLEAQAFGVPVLLSDIPVHQEVYGDSVLYCNAESPVDISEKITDIMKDEALRKRLIEKGTENVKKYSWRKTAENTLRVYTEALKP